MALDEGEHLSEDERVTDGHMKHLAAMLQRESLEVVANDLLAEATCDVALWEAKSCDGVTNFGSAINKICRGGFAEALRGSGLFAELPALSAGVAGLAPVALLAPSDDALAALPDHARCNADSMRRLLAAHVWVGGGGDLAQAESVVVLSGQTYQVSATEVSGVLSVGNARVSLGRSVAFCGGVIYPIDAVLWSLEVVESCRREQVGTVAAGAGSIWCWGSR